MIIDDKVVDCVVHSGTEIKGFFGQYRFLSNHWECPVAFEGVIYPSSEAAFMAAKTLDLAARVPFETMDPAEAKRAGRTLALREDWELVKIDIMRSVVFDKFLRNLEIRVQLVETGFAYLEETNNWGDRIWGVCDGSGNNLLGQILMDTRSYWQ